MSEALARRRATYQDVLEAPADQVAELVDGELFLSPRPSLSHGVSATDLQALLGGPFRFGQGGPGGWRFIHEPELHFDPHVLVPDIAGWRVERLSAGALDGNWTSVVPDWICEVLSPSTAKLDLERKRPRYHTAGVPWLWIVNPRLKSIEVFERAERDWTLRHTLVGESEAALSPFDAILNYGLIWSRP